MGTGYLPAKPDVVEFVREVMEEYHPHLIAAGVRVNVLIAYGELKQHGYPCAATIKINSVQDRIEGKADATMKLDWASWDRLSEAERRAVVDHEFYHLIPKVEGKIDDVPFHKTDDAGRPVLKMRRHDLIVGGFQEIAVRHGRAALEAQHVGACREALRQLTLWGDDQAGQTGRPDMRTIVDGVPSKWVYGPEREGGNGYIAVASGTASADWDEVMANARLIAAAPDLLAACETVLTKLDYLVNLWGAEGVTRTIQDQLRAAVAMTKGGAA